MDHWSAMAVGFVGLVFAVKITATLIQIEHHLVRLIAAGQEHEPGPR